MQALKDRLPEKRRSDAVLGLEYVVTAHQDWFKGLDKAAQDAYLMDSSNGYASATAPTT